MVDSTVRAEDPHEAFFLVSRWQELPDGTREKELADVALRVLAHALFDPCPAIEALADPTILERFLAHAHAAGLSMDWTLHLELAAWLRSIDPYRERIDEEALVQAMAAAASRFVVLDRGPSCGVALACAHAPNRLVTAWKCSAPDVGKRIELLSVEETPPLPALFGYFFFPSFELDAFLPWTGVGPIVT